MPKNKPAVPKNKPVTGDSREGKADSSARLWAKQQGWANDGEKSFPKFMAERGWKKNGGGNTARWFQD